VAAAKKLADDVPAAVEGMVTVGEVRVIATCDSMDATIEACCLA
jgi:hypothetical protein